MQNVCVNNKLKNEMLNKDIFRGVFINASFARKMVCSSNIIHF